MVPPENKTASHSALDIKIVFSPGNNGHIAGARRTRSSVCGQPSVFSVPSSLQKAVCSMGQSSLSPHPYRRQCAVWDSLHCPLIPTEGSVQYGTVFTVPSSLQKAVYSFQSSVSPQPCRQCGTVFSVPSSLEKSVSSMGQSSLSPHPYRRQCPVWDSLHCPLSPTEGSVQYGTVFTVPSALQKAVSSTVGAKSGVRGQSSASPKPKQEKAVHVHRGGEVRTDIITTTQGCGHNVFGQAATAAPPCDIGQAPVHGETTTLCPDD